MDYSYNYSLLVQAIVEQAVRDYSDSVRLIKTVPPTNGRDAPDIVLFDKYDTCELKKNKIYNPQSLIRKRMHECEEFFYSPWYCELCGIDPDRIMHRVQHGKPLRLRRVEGGKR